MSGFARGNHGDSPVLVVLLVGQFVFGSRMSAGCFEELQPFVRQSSLANEKSVFEFLPSGFVHGQSIFSCERSLYSGWASAVSSG
jgi:hypothetical protein